MDILALDFCKHYESPIFPPLFQRSQLTSLLNGSHNCLFQIKQLFSATSQVHLEEVYFGSPKLSYTTPELDARDS